MEKTHKRPLQGSNVGSDYRDDEIKFMMAVEKYKREKNRPFPTWTEILEIARSLGYRLVAPPQ